MQNKLDRTYWSKQRVARLATFNVMLRTAAEASQNLQKFSSLKKNQLSI